MKNKKNLLAVLGIGILLFIAYMVPTVVTRLEDRHLQSENKKFEIEEITLNTGEADLATKLSAIQQVLQDNVVVQESQTVLSQEPNDVEKKAREFLSILYDNSETTFLKFSATLLVSADANINKVYSLWKCYAVDGDEQEYVFWIDKETEKVLAFEMPYFNEATNTEECYKLAQKLEEYYGFTGNEIMDEVQFFPKLVYAETAIRLFNEAEGTEVVLMLYKSGEQLSFNMYPSQISVYDASS